MKHLLSSLLLASSFLSACQPQAPERLDFEICDDDIDNDGDSLQDCSDDECTTIDPVCARPERCDDNIDNDFNGVQDCQDEACAGTPTCICTEAQVILSNQLPVAFEGDSADGVSAVNVLGCQTGEALESFFHLSFPDLLRVDIKIESLDGIDMVLQTTEDCQEFDGSNRVSCSPGVGLDSFDVTRFDATGGPRLFFVGAREAGQTGRFRLTFSEVQ